MKISRILVFLVVFSLCFCSLAFADDLEPDSSGSSSSAISDEDMDNAIRDLSNSLYQVQLLNDNKATTYTTTDIYNFMVNHFLMGGAQNGYMYQIYSFVTSLNTKVQAIMTYSNSIREYTELIYDNITGDNTPITLYDLIGDHLGNIANMLAITEGDTTLSAGELLLLINNTIDDSYIALGNIQTTLDSIQNNIALLYAVMTDIAESNNSIVTQTTTMNANMLQMISNLQSFNNDLNNITWLPFSSFIGFATSLDNARQSTFITTPGQYSTGVYTFQYNTSYHQVPKGLFRLSVRFTNNNNIPLGYNNNPTLNIYINNSDIPLDPQYYSIYKSGTSYFLYFTDIPYSSSNEQKIYFEFKHNSSYDPIYFFNVSSTVNKLEYIPIDTFDYYTVLTPTILSSLMRVVDKFESLYASDDLIASKEKQQPVENQILEDFTGNGSASVSVGDAVNVKQASNAIKSGLNTGANSGLALDYAFGYNNPAGLFVWFTQDTADWFTLYQPTRGVKDYSSVIWSDEIPDHITKLDNKYIRGLSND